MRYPYILLSQKQKMNPLFPDLKSLPMDLDLSLDGDFLKDLLPGDQKAFQKKLDMQMKNHYSWGLSSYLENRRTLLSTCPQMVEEKRFFHLGLDIIVGPGTTLYIPMDAIVKDCGFEAGVGNFGGYLLLEHSGNDFETFYTLYGHLSPESLPAKGTALSAGKAVGCTGEFNENGNWFYHTHLQILTQRGLDEGYQFRGYCQEEKLSEIDSLCPSPLPFFLAAQLSKDR